LKGNSRKLEGEIPADYEDTGGGALRAYDPYLPFGVRHRGNGDRRQHIKEKRRKRAYLPTSSFDSLLLSAWVPPPKRFYTVLLKPDANRCRLMYPSPAKSVPTRSSVAGSGTTVVHAELSEVPPLLMPSEANPVHAVLVLRAMWATPVALFGAPLGVSKVARVAAFAVVKFRVKV